MMTVQGVAALARALPDVTEGSRYGNRTWFVDGKAFAWERPFSKADIKRFGADTPPGGPILAISVADLNEKEAALSANPGVFFTITHFAGYTAILVRLDRATKKVVREALIDGWLASAPAAVAQHYLETRKR
jgi:hypothetical protein